MRREDMTREAAEDILELPPRYTKEDVRRSYTDLARMYHPDAAAQNHFDKDIAQARMVEANKAYQLLKRQFSQSPGRVIERVSESVSANMSDWGASGIAGGYADVDWRAGAYDTYGTGADPWDFAEDWGAAPAPEKPPLSVRTVLLGSVVPRILFIALFGWIWWRTFPLLPQNMGRAFPAGAWTFMDVARVVALGVYPTYFLLYEALSGYVSDFVREVLNGLVSILSKHYVDLRPHSASYGCSLYKLLREQFYALLMLPGVLYLVGLCMAQENMVLKIVFGILAVALGLDTLAAVARGGFVNVWTTALAERVEAQYLLMRARVLRRCGKWDGRR